jgi:hypothetical protein
MASSKIHVAVRLDAEHVAQVDALIPLFSKPWRDATRSDVLRALVIAGFKTIKADPGALGGAGGEPAGTAE